MIAVVEASGAQVLPPVGDPRARVTSWAAFTVCDADLRARSAEHRELAERLVLAEVEMCEAAKGRCGSRALSTAHFLACGHRRALCNRDVTHLQSVALRPPGPCPVCGQRGAVRWSQAGDQL